MHFVLINQYYPPDGAPTGLMLEAVAKELAEAGHRVDVLCSAGGYTSQSGRSQEMPRDDGRLRVIHLGATSFGRKSTWGKISDYLSFYLGVAWNLAKPGNPADAVVVLTTPPFLSVLARLFSGIGGYRHSHWIMDLYPDVMVSHGIVKKGSLPDKALGSLTRFGFGGKRCATVLTLGPDMAESVSTYMPPGKNPLWVPLWGTAEPDAHTSANGSGVAGAANELRVRRGWSENEVVFMYSGNMGLGHRFSEFLSAMSPEDDSAPMRRHRMAFFGGGRRRVEVEEFIKRHPAAQVELHDYVPRQDLAAHLHSGDVHLASLEPSWDGTMVPSKLQGIFEIGRPVIFVGSDRSSSARWILESGAGWIVPPGNTRQLHESIEAACDPGERKLRSERAIAFSRENFSKTKNAARIASHLVQSS